MDLDLIERLMRMLERSELNELDVTEAGMRIRLAKHKPDAASAWNAPLSPPSPPAGDAPSTPSKTVRILAGMAGAFYRAPAPGAAPFVTEGDRVREGQQIAIVEAMKLLNPIEAECDGVVRAILPADGDGVEPGDPMFEIEAD